MFESRRPGTPSCSLWRRQPLSRDGTRPTWLVRVITDPSSMILGDAGRKLFDGPFRYPTFDLPSYDLQPDGDRFLMISDSSPDEIRVVLNWFEELKELVPVP